MALISTSGNLYTFGHSVLSESIDIYIAGSLSASGFLDSDNVVFYHPLDDYSDGINGDIWNGSASFGPAIISSGIGAIGGPVISSSGEFIDVYAGNLGCWLVPKPDDDNRVLFVHLDRNQGIKAQVISVSGDTISAGSTYSAAPNTTILINKGANQVINVSGNLYVCVLAMSNSSRVGAISFEVDNDVVSFNSLNYDIEQSGSFAFGGDMSLSPVLGATSGGFIFSYYDGTGGSQDNLYLRYGTIADNGDVFAGSPLIIPSGDLGRVVVLDQDKAILKYRDLANDNQDVARIVNISGTNMSLEPAIDVDGAGNLVNTMVKINDSCFVTAHRSEYSAGTIIFNSYNVSGSVITHKFSVPKTANSQTLWVPRLAYDAQQGRGIYSVQEQATSMQAGFFTVDENYFMNIGNITPYSYDPDLTSGEDNTATYLGDDRFVVFDSETETVRLVYTQYHDIYSSESAIYPSTIDSSGFTMGCWANFSVSSGAIVRIERGYKLDITSGYISINENAYWNDSEIINFLDIISDYDDYFVLFDFRYQGDNNWNLCTSINGLPWINQGIQNSGSQSPITTDTAPRVTAQDGNIGQLLDEAIMWADTEQFSSSELFKLHYLGKTKHAPLDEYSLFDLAFSYNPWDTDLSASGNLFISAYDQITKQCSLYVEGYETVNNSIDLFITGQESVSVSGDLFIGGHGIDNSSNTLFILASDLFSFYHNLFINGSTDISASNDLFINALSSNSGQCDLFLSAPALSSVSSGYLFISGHEQTNNSFNLFIHGHTDSSASINLFTKGHDRATASGDLFVKGHQPTTGSCDLVTLSDTDAVASGDLFVKGHQPTTGSCDLYICAYDNTFVSSNLFVEGYGTQVASNNLFIRGTAGVVAKSIDWLLRTSDHYPQIIGTLEGAVTATIQLWEITDGQNTPVSLMSNRCYQIGNTGRWGWSTANLPTVYGHARQYFYIMTSDTTETFDGQFFLELPEEAKWIYPDDQDEYLMRI